MKYSNISSLKGFFGSFRSNVKRTQRRTVRHQIKAEMQRTARLINSVKEQ